MFAWLWRDENQVFVRVHDQQREVFGIDRELPGILNEACNAIAELAALADSPGLDEDIDHSMNLRLEARLGFPVRISERVKNE